MLDTHNVNSDNVEAIDVETQAKYEHLQTILKDMESVLVALRLDRRSRFSSNRGFPSAMTYLAGPKWI